MTGGGVSCFRSMGGVEEFPYIAEDFFTYIGIDRLVSRAGGSSKMIKIKVYLKCKWFSTRCRNNAKFDMVLNKSLRK